MVNGTLPTSRPSDTDLAALVEMARCLREIGAGRVPK
jgi:hypothetical protein